VHQVGGRVPAGLEQSRAKGKHRLRIVRRAEVPAVAEPGTSRRRLRFTLLARRGTWLFGSSALLSHYYAE
jgi:hypothetical protein